MKGLNPFIDQGIDIRLCPGSCPMDMNEYIIDEDINYLNGVLHIIEHHAVPAWEQQNGKIIAIKDMETSHIKNCIHMIHRKQGAWRRQYLRYFENELRRRKHERTNYQEPF